MRRAAALVLVFAACGSESPAPVECGSGLGLAGTLIPGPGQAGFDGELARKARQYDRQFHAIHTLATRLSTELRVPRTATRTRALIERFLREDDGYDLLAYTGTTAESLGQWGKATGAYAGAGLAADAFRYGALRDAGEACAEVELAREQLRRGLEALHKVSEITGKPGVIARSVVSVELPHDSPSELFPVFDAEGNPVPAEKNNGTWHADSSGKNAGWVWEDSISRDMLIGWMLGLGPAWEVIAEDPSFDEALKSTLRADALAIGRELRVVRESGYDLEVIDADGRITYHGYLNEYSFERGFYLERAENGFNASLALGVVAVLSMVSGDAGLRAYLIDELVTARRLPNIAATSMLFNQYAERTNFSDYNMSFSGVFLAHRYVDHAGAEAVLARALRDQLYEVPGQPRQPREQKQSFYDLVFAAGAAGRTAKLHEGPAFDARAIAGALDTLREFPEPPYYDRKIENCDAAEIAAKRCVLEDGVTEVALLGEVGWNGLLVAETPIPMRLRPGSNFWWRSNPYGPNGGGEDRLLPGPDFRLAYWMGRWIR